MDIISAFIIWFCAGIALWYCLPLVMRWLFMAGVYAAELMDSGRSKRK